MRNARIAAGLVLALIVGAAAYAATLAARSGGGGPRVATSNSASEALLDWLSATPNQRDALRTHDAGFAEELASLREAAAEQRANLASTLEDAGASDEAVMRQVELTIEADNAVERRVARYLLSVRDHLTPDQQRRLFGLCAQRVRECARGGRGHQFGRGGAASRPEDDSPGRGMQRRQRGGRGAPPGQGPP